MQPSKRQLQCFLSFLLALISVTWQQKLSIKSASPVVGVTTTYTFTITNFIPSPSTSVTLNIIFSSWTPTVTSPFISSPNVQLLPSGQSLACSLVFSKSTVSCRLLPSDVTASMTVTVGNINNPSSLKPYPVNLSMQEDSKTTLLSASLTCTQIPQTIFTINQYDLTVSTTSNSANFYLQFSNYFDVDTFLNFTYNSTLIQISAGSSTAYSVLANSQGSIVLSRWAAVTTTSRFISPFTIVNPPAAITFSLTAILSFVLDAVAYNIQSFTASFQLVPLAFLTLSFSPSFQYGRTDNSFGISNICAQSAVGNALQQAYMILTYNTSQLSNSPTSNCNLISATACSLSPISNSTTVTNFIAHVVNIKQSPVQLSSYTFYQGTFYKLCEEIANISFVSQAINPSVDLSACDTVYPNNPNSVVLVLPIQGALVGDVVTIVGIKGKLTDSSIWIGTTDLVYAYTHVLDASNIISANSISIPLNYINPTYVTSNSIGQCWIARQNFIYASMQSPAVSLCPITSGHPIADYTIRYSAVTTYSTTTLALTATLSIFDYSSVDYLVLDFLYNGNPNVYAIKANANPQPVEASLNGITCTYMVVNSSRLLIHFNNQISFPSAIFPALAILVKNINQPVAVGVTSVNLCTYSGVSQSSKEVLQSNTIDVTVNQLQISVTPIYLLRDLSVSLTISNPLRTILTYNPSISLSSLTIQMPFDCTNLVSKKISLDWNSILSTLTGNANGNTTRITVSLGTCSIGYFIGAIQATVLESINGVASNSNSVTLTNYCGDYCRSCSIQKVCTGCFSSNTNRTLLSGGVCYDSCPSGSSIQTTDSSACVLCHPSCQNCKGGSYLDCAACASGFTMTNGYCVSICGPEKYQSQQQCLNCAANCEICLNETNCYICRTGALLLGTVCEFTTCASPCKTCQGSASSCRSCVSGFNLYLTSCVEMCPSGTYSLNQSCVAINESITYFPITICSIFIFLIAVAMRIYSNRKIGNVSRSVRRNSFSSEIGASVNIQEPTINYKLNVIRLMAVFMAYLQIVSAIVVLCHNNSFKVENGANYCLIVGLATALLANIVFGIGYYRIVYRNNQMLNQPHQEASQYEETRELQNHRARNTLIFLLSCLFTFRTYKILYANLFIDRPTQSNTNINQTEASLAAIHIQPNKINSSLGKMSIRSHKNKTALTCKSTNFAPPLPPSVSSTQPGHILPIMVLKSKVMVDIGEHKSIRKFNHPFHTYLTLLSLFTSSLLLLIGFALQLIGCKFINMLFWSIDALIVQISSIVLTSWDLWSFSNLARDQQHTEMSSEMREEGQQVDNLPNDTQQQVKIDPRPSPVKVSVRYRNKSPDRFETKEQDSHRKSSDENRYDHVPTLKQFEGIQDVMSNQQENTKDERLRKWNVGSGRRNMAGTSKQRMRKSNNNLRSTSHGWKLDDIYLNFWDPSLDQRRRRKEDGYEQSASIANADDNVSGAVDLPNINFEGISQTGIAQAADKSFRSADIQVQEIPEPQSKLKAAQSVAKQADAAEQPPGLRDAAEP